jgi:acyl dehydratase
MKHYDSLISIEPHVGSLLGTSDWLEIDQSRIDRFAAVTGDDQWIHVDSQRAGQSTFGTTIAHGFLTLSLIPALLRTSHHIGGVRMSVNYGLNRVRFPAPVPVGSLVRAHFTLQSFEKIAGGIQLVTKVSIEREGTSKPVCVAETVSRLYV